METKAKKMLRNVETCWISIKSPTQRIMRKYKTLLIKMDLDMSLGTNQKGNARAIGNFDFH